MIEEGIKGIEIIEKEDHTLIRHTIGADVEETEIPKLNLRNETAIQIWHMQNQGLTLTESVQFLGLKLSRVEMYMLTHKLMAIKSRIKRHERDQLNKDNRKGFVNASNP